MQFQYQMKGGHYILKTGLLGLCMTAGLFSVAQQHKFRFFPVKDLSFSSHGFIGKIGNQFVLLNRSNPEGLGLYIYDTALQTGVDHAYAFPKQLRAVLTYEKSLAFLSLVPDSAGMTCHYIEVGENGDVLRRKKHPLPLKGQALQVLISNNQKHVLFYRYLQNGNDSALVQGFMIGMDGEIENHLLYNLKYDKERDLLPKTFVDNNGNTHVFVFDQFNNYRLSSTLTINTMSLAEDEIVSETFELQKVKLKTMDVFQNEDCNCMQAEGVYTDGMEKTMQGFYSISFPVNRKKELKPRFFPLANELVNEFRKGFGMTEKFARNSLQLQKIQHSDSGSFVIMRLNPPRVDIRSYLGGSSASPLISRANRVSSPRLIVVKMGSGQRIEWYTIKSLDVFRSPITMPAIENLPKEWLFNYNNVFLMGGEKLQTGLVLYEADSKEEPNPVFVSIKDGSQSVEKFPEKKLTFSSIQSLGPNHYASLYTNMAKGESGIMIIEKKE
jgi:hypothetical protein